MDTAQELQLKSDRLQRCSLSLHETEKALRTSERSMLSLRNCNMILERYKYDPTLKMMPTEGQFTEFGRCIKVFNITYPSKYAFSEVVQKK